MHVIPTLRTLNKGLVSTVLVIGLGASSPTFADDLSGYAADSTKQVVRNNYGECWRTSSWTKEMANEQCDPNLVAKAPEPAPVAMVAPQPKRTVQRINLASDTYFGFDEAELTDSGKAKLDELADQISGKQDPQIQITGYTDRLGAESYNMTLSERRAEAVKDYLVDKGIQTEIIETAAMGPKDPVVTCEGERGNALIECLGPNRRTVVEFSAFEVVETR